MVRVTFSCHLQRDWATYLAHLHHLLVNRFISGAACDQLIAVLSGFRLSGLVMARSLGDEVHLIVLVCSAVRSHHIGCLTVALNYSSCEDYGPRVAGAHSFYSCEKPCYHKGHAYGHRFRVPFE